MADTITIPPKRKGYQWPSSALTQDEMEILYKLREATGKPINLLLKEAIQRLRESIKPEGQG